MATTPNTAIIRIAPIILIAFLALGCEKAKSVSQQPPDKIIATVNGEPIYDKDIKLALALRLRDNPNLKITPNSLNEQLNLMIDERLTLQHKERSGSRVKIIDENLVTR